MGQLERISSLRAVMEKTVYAKSLAFCNFMNEITCEVQVICGVIAQPAKPEESPDTTFKTEE